MTKPKALKFDSGDYARWSMFTNAGISFAHGRREKNKVVQLTSFDTCREAFANRIYDDMAIEKHRLSDKKLQCLVRITLAMYDYDKMNFAKKERRFENQTKAGLKVLNILEDHYGWPLTKMFNVEPFTSGAIGSTKRQCFSKLLVASNKWRKSSHITSLFLLLFRLPTKNMQFLKVSDYEHLMKLCRQYAGLPESGNKGVAKAVSGDKYHVAKTIKFWGPLMTNLNELFGKMPSRSIFSKDDYNDCYRSEGISKLCGFRCSNPKINKKFAIEYNALL
jgi:hypothetical protein